MPVGPDDQRWLEKIDYKQAQELFAERVEYEWHASAVQPDWPVVYCPTCML
ncbi:hypothetical protein EMIT07CA2_10680 [Brevibacillus sp. IT-7CA2]